MSNHVLNKIRQAFTVLTSDVQIIVFLLLGSCEVDALVPGLLISFLLGCLWQTHRATLNQGMRSNILPWSSILSRKKTK